MTLAEGEDEANDPVYTHIPLVSLETKDTAPSGLIGHFLRYRGKTGESNSSFLPNRMSSKLS